MDPESFWSNAVQGHVSKSWMPTKKYYATGLLQPFYLQHHLGQVLTITAAVNLAVRNTSVAKILDEFAQMLFLQSDLLIACSLDYACVHYNEMESVLSGALKSFCVSTTSKNSSLSSSSEDFAYWQEWQAERARREIWIHEELLEIMRKKSCPLSPKDAQSNWFQIVSVFLESSIVSDAKLSKSSNGIWNRWEGEIFGRLFQENTWSSMIKQRSRSPPLFVGSNFEDPKDRIAALSLSAFYDVLIQKQQQLLPFDSLSTLSVVSALKTSINRTPFISFDMIEELLEATLSRSSIYRSIKKEILNFISTHFLPSSLPLIILCEQVRILMFAIEHTALTSGLEIVQKQILRKLVEKLYNFTADSIRTLPILWEIPNLKQQLTMPKWRDLVQPHWPRITSLRKLRSNPLRINNTTSTTTSSSSSSSSSPFSSSSSSSHHEHKHVEVCALDNPSCRGMSRTIFHSTKPEEKELSLHQTAKVQAYQTRLLNERKLEYPSFLQEVEIQRKQRVQKQLVLLNGMLVWTEWSPPAIAWLYPVQERKATSLLPYRDYAFNRDFLKLMELWLFNDREAGGHFRLAWDGRAFVTESFAGQTKSVNITSNADHEIMFHTHPWQSDGRLFSPPSPMDMAEFVYMTLIQDERPDAGVQAEIIIGQQNIYVSYATIRVRELFGRKFNADKTSLHEKARQEIRAHILDRFDPLLNEVLDSNIEISLPALYKWQTMAFEVCGIRMDIFSWNDIFGTEGRTEKHKYSLPVRIRLPLRERE